MGEWMGGWVGGVGGWVGGWVGRSLPSHRPPRLERRFRELCVTNGPVIVTSMVRKFEIGNLARKSPSRTLQSKLLSSVRDSPKTNTRKRENRRGPDLSRNSGPTITGSSNIGDSN